MRPHHRTCVLVVVVGLVLASCFWATSGSAAIQPPTQSAVRTPTSRSETFPAPGGVTTPTTAFETYTEWQQRLSDEAAAVAALNAAQAQALADQLAAAIRRSLQAVPAPPVASQTIPAPSGDCYGVNQYAAYIYQRESGCNLASVNGSGCAGIGQACPGSKMGCSLTDAPCQLAYFEAYALGRYGSWEAAYQFWQSHGWW